MFWNHRIPLFESAAVRRALTMGINRRELVRALNLPPEVPLTDALFTVRQLRRDLLPAPLPFNPDSAGRLLDAAVYVEEQLRRIGVRMDVQVIDGSVLWRRLGQGEFEAAVFRFVNSIESQLRWLAKGSPLGYRDPGVAALLHEAERTGDPDGRDRIYRDLAAILHADLPVTFLFPVVQNVVAHRRLRGARKPVQGQCAAPYGTPLA